MSMQHTVKTVDGSLGFLTVGTTSSYSKWFYLWALVGRCLPSEVGGCGEVACRQDHVLVSESDQSVHFNEMHWVGTALCRFSCTFWI